MAFEGAFQDLVRQAASRAVQAASDGIVELMQTLVSVQHYGTGELYDSIGRDEAEDDGSGYHVRVYADAPQAEWTDQGASPHIIVPQGNYPLRFYWDAGPDGPGVYYFNVVQHPGFIGSLWFTNSTLEWEGRLQSEFDNL